MFVLGNFVSAVAVIVNYAFIVLNWLIIIRALISWVNPDPYNLIVQFLYATTEPILEPFRRIVPTYRIGIDLSPILAIVVIWFLQRFLVKTLFDIAARLS